MWGMRLMIVLAATTVAAGCASTGAVPRPFPGAAGPVVARPAPASPGSEAVVGSALALRGAPYRDGGSTPTGFDCSGFVQYVFAEHGVRLPRAVRDQYETGHAVKANQIRAGDLLFFVIAGRSASHVGIAIGGDRFVHAPSSKGVVRVEQYSLPYWSKRYAGARRVTK